MWNYDCGFVPVVNKERRIIGAVTDRDVCMAAYTQGRPVQDIPVCEAMANEVYSCLPDDSIAEAEEIMRRRRVRRLPVVDLAGQLIGIVSLNDIARESARQKTQVHRDVTGDDVAATLAAICQPRQAVALPPSA